MAQAKEWTMEMGWNGRADVEYHKSGPWTIVIDPDNRAGFIRKKNRKTLVEVLVPKKTIEKGMGIPNHVVDKANELTNLPPLNAGETSE